MSEEKEDTNLDRDNDAALAAPRSITLDGKRWYLSPLTKADFGRLREHVRDLAKAETRSPLKALAEVYADLPPEMQAAAMREAVAQSGEKKPEPTREAVAEKVGSLDGVRYAFWLAARKQHAELTVERATELVANDDIKFEIMEAVLTIEGQRPNPDQPESLDPKSD